MAMLAPALGRSLAATGYLRDDGQPAAATVTVANGELSRRGSFQPDVSWRQDDLSVYFKYAPNPSREEISVWQQEVWNEGSAPLLWVVRQDRTELYNGFARPQKPGAAAKNRLDVFAHDAPTMASDAHAKDLADLNATAGRLSMESGAFWREEPRVSRTTAVDRRLLQDIMDLEASLVAGQLQIDDAQALIGRAIFAKYLVDRNIVTNAMLRKECGRSSLSEVLRHPPAAESLFGWLRGTFNGDMFPSDARVPEHRHLLRIANFLDGDDPATGQRSLFPYRFDIIPIELISSICELFAHSAVLADRGDPRKHGVYYTPRAAVSLILDQVMAGMRGDETVLDITCGCGIFLVEALRRLVEAKAGDGPPTRSMIRDVLYKQIYGVEQSDAAIRVAALSLYLAALELDPRPSDARGMKFKPIVGRTLIVGDAHNIERTDAGKARLTTAKGRKQFDLVVGNPPFTEGHDRGNRDDPGKPQPPHDRSIAFAERALQFAHEKTRFGMILRATPFFSVGPGREAAQRLVESLSPATIINLSSCSSWLFERANVPVVVLAGRYRPQQNPEHMMLVQAHWSPSGRAGHRFDVAASDAQELHIASWKRNPDLFKATFLGSYEDLLLLEKLRDTHRTLASQVRSVGAKFSEGLKLGAASRRHGGATHLHGLPHWRKGDMEPFRMSDEVGRFTHDLAERPRKRKVYRAPLLVVREFVAPMGGTPRALAAVSEHDGVFSNSYYGASFAREHAGAAHVLAGVLSSALGTWYFIMAGSTFGLGPRRLLQEDLVKMPVPDVLDAPTSASQRVLALAREFADQPPDASGWERLDEAVFDLYELDDQERQVVRDGVFRASWQWQRGRLASIASASSEELARYARAFLSSFEPWLPDDDPVRIRAEIYCTERHPLRVVRFLVDEDFRLPAVEVIDMSSRGSSSRMEDVIERAGTRFGGSPTLAIDGLGDVEITTEGEILIVRPSARRHWLCTSAFDDARAVLRRARVSHRDEDLATAPPPRKPPAQDEEIALRYAVGYRDLAQLDADFGGWADAGVWPED